MPTTTVTDLKTCKRIKDVQLRLDLSDNSNLRGLAQELETFREEPLCSILVADAHENVRDWTSPEVAHLFDAIGDLPGIVHLAFENLSTGNAEATEEPLSVFPVTLMTNLLLKTATRLESLVMDGVTLTGANPEELLEFAEAMSALRCLRSCIIISNFDLKVETETPFNPYDPVENPEDPIDPGYPLDTMVTAISRLPLLLEVHLVTYAWYEAVFTDQFNSSQPLKDLFQAPQIQTLTLGQFHLANEGLKDIARLLRTNNSLRRLQLYFAPSPTRTCLAALTLLANAFSENTTLQVFEMDFEESCPKLDAFLLKIADALAKNPDSALEKLKVTSPFTYGAEVEEAFCHTLQSNYSLRRVEFQTVSKTTHNNHDDNNDDEEEEEEEEVENYSGLEGRKRTELDLYLRLNERGRAQLIRNNGLSRAKWIQALAEWTHDLDALHYYLRTNPWLCRRREEEEEERGTTLEMNVDATPQQETPVLLQELQQMILAGFQTTQGSIQQLNQKVEAMNDQHAQEKRVLEEEIKRLREEVAALKLVAAD